MGILRRLADRAVDKMDALGRPSEADLARLSPAERARDAYWQERAAAARVGREFTGPDHRLAGRVLQGPAGEVVHGVRQPEPAPDPVRDEARWEEVMLAERAARDRAREPYLAPVRHPITIDRVATRGVGGWGEVTDYLAASGLAASPHLVYGVYRVPDRINPGLTGERGGVVEWDVVHAAEGPTARAAVPVAVRLPAEQRWVLRSVGRPSVLDEDLVVAVTALAGVGPERMLGISRDLRMTSSGGGDGDGPGSVVARVVGVGFIVPAGAEAAAVAEVVRRAPVQVPEGAPSDVHIAVLEWDAIAQAVHPARRERPRMPSPFPYLPATPQELLRAYLEVVGVDPADTHGVQVTYDEPMDLLGRSTGRSWLRSSYGGDKIMCADGTARGRLAGGEHIVVVYRDRPEYVEGRDRFAAYAREVLRADLDRAGHMRGAVPKRTPALLRAAERVGDVVMFFSDDSAGSGPPPPRYCWPPAG